MRQASALLFLVLVTHTYSAPQFITWKDGKIGVNFGGYHASVGMGAGGAAGGLFAEAGTPHGQSAMAGLGGQYGNKVGGFGGLFAGAQAAPNVHASAGLSGLAGSNGYATGNGFANAQAGSQVASSGLGGQSSSAGSSGYKFSGTQSFEIPATVVKETEVSVVPVEHKPVYKEKKKIHTEVKLETDNEVKPVALSSGASAHIDVNSNVQPAVLVKEVYVEPERHIIEKTKIRTHYKPHHHHHLHKTAYIGGYVGGGAALPPPSYTSIQKRVDVGVEGSENVGVIDASSHGHGGGQTTFTKEVTVEKNPTFFADIFNIPISTLQAVGSFLSNSAANTKISVQKSASVEAGADTDAISSKHAPLSSSSSSKSSDTHISVETPTVSQIIDGIFAIPINTLGAVNKFLENNVTGRKRIQVEEGTGEPARVRLGPHARRRANKQVIYVQQENSSTPKPEEAH